MNLMGYANNHGGREVENEQFIKIEICNALRMFYPSLPALLTGLRIGMGVTLADRVVVMKRPGQIGRIITIDMPKPRDKGCELFRRYNTQIRDLLDKC